MTATSAGEFAALLVSELTGQNTESDTTRLYTDFGNAETKAGARMVLREILDHITDYEYGAATDQRFTTTCAEATARLQTRSDASSSLVTGLVALICLNVTLLDQRFRPPNADEQRQADDSCTALFVNAPVGRAIELVYAPDGNPEEERFWRELDFDSLRYHRAGTTSFILKGRKRLADNEAGARAPVAVKCVLFPWNKLSAVSKATDDYATTYGHADVSGRVVKPTASSGQWVLMPFQGGRTLGEHLAQFNGQNPPPSMAARIAEAREVAQKLVTALHQLARSEVVDGSKQERQHLDLSPNNIIFDPDTGEVRFIDLGMNHLYSRQVGIAEHDDAVYIAPEIKNRRGASATADVYSLGIILMEVLAGAPPRDGRTPDVIWTASPALGRALEDLIEEHPDNRLLQLRQGAGFSFAALGRHLEFCFDLVGKEPVAQPGRWPYLWARIAPTSREFLTQYRQWFVWRTAGSERGEHDRYLLFFSALATMAWWFIVAKTALLKADDIVTLKAAALPTGMELYANVIAFSQGLVAAKFYQTMLARLTVRGITGLRARCTEVVMRSMALVAVPTTILSTFDDSLYWVWPWTCAAGALAVTLSNWLIYTTAQDLLAGGGGLLSTTPEASRRFARGYEQWWWTMLLYALIIVTIGTGVQVGALKDLWAYVFILVAVTLGVHYGAKCTAAGPEIRGSIARAFSIGQRAALVRSRSAGP